MMFPGTISRQYGPSRIPARMYPVTFGSLNFLVIRVIRYPANSIRAVVIITTDAYDVA